MKLVSPSVKYKSSFLSYAKELRAEGNPDYESEAEVTEESFEEFVKNLVDHSKGINLPEGYVSATTYWLIDDEEYIGRVSIRHELSESLKQAGGHIGYLIRPSKRRMGYGSLILKLGLEKARELGIKNVLVTCNKTNIGSKKIIEKNGGILENEVLQEGDAPKLRYWINV